LARLSEAHSIVFSSEVAAGSREENASKQKLTAANDVGPDSRDARVTSA
jgi:hypothetical protein